MLFQRQQLLLSLVDSVGEPVGHTDLQKLLFLYTQECEKVPSYDFVPYRFGCFSFTSYADKRRLTAGGFLVEDDQQWRLTDTGREMARKSTVGRPKLLTFSRRYSHLRGTPLVAEVYRRYPYYATRSEIVNKVLPEAESRTIIEQARPTPPAPGLLTIGYEGKSLEAYLNQLLQAGVSLLCDVRRNPLSRKYGFSKGTLSKACEGVGIEYVHIPELGIATDRRRELNTQADYDALFEEYERIDLPGQEAAVARIRAWIEVDGRRVALTCYELAPHQCHRHCVAEAVSRQMPTMYSVRHLDAA